MGARTSSAVTAVAGVAGVLTIVSLLTLAAGQGSGTVLRGRPGAVWGTADDPVTPPIDEPLTGGPPDSSVVGSLLRYLAEIVVLGLMAAGVALLVWGLVQVARTVTWRWSWRRTHHEPVEEVEFDVVDVADSLSAELARQAEAQRALLEQGSPRNGIVACWNEFEQAAARVGHARQGWQTSSEFTLEILDLVQADGGAVGRLAGHYREARFSVHTISEADRDQARDDLEVILVGLGQRRRGVAR